MSESAQTLIEAAMRQLNIVAAGETPTDAELADGFEALQIMLRRWSAENMNIYFIEQDTLTMDGSSSYTIGSGGDCNTTWPWRIKGAVVDSEYVLQMIGESLYRRLSTNTISAPPTYLYYNPEYPLGLLYPYPTAGSSMVIDSLKPLSEPAELANNVTFPPPYDAAIKWNLALELAPEFGQEPSAVIAKMAADSLRGIRSQNFASQINEARLDTVLPGGRYRYNIDEG
jgi:hypothetical protein